MDLISLVIALVVIAFVLFIISRYVQDPVLRKWLLIGVVVIVVLWLLFGVLHVGNLGSIRLD